MSRKPDLAAILTRQRRLRCTRECLTCEKSFRVKARSPVNSGMTKYCSIECYHESVRVKARAKILERFDLDQEQWLQMRDACDDRCEICGNRETVMNNAKTRVNNLTIDHDHVTGKFRGLLCVRCNFGLSHIDSSADWLDSAAKYLRRGKESPKLSSEDLEQDIELMLRYLHLRLEMRDFHGVMDAAADIREIEAKLSVIKQQ